MSFNLSWGCGEERNRGRPRPHARSKAGADIALSLPAEYRDLKNDTRAEYIIHSTQPAAERRWSNRRTNTHAAHGL